MGNQEISKYRIEAFSDGVLAIILTIMVLELKAPHAALFSSIFELLPVFVSYLISFIFIAVYWVNHHSLFHHAKTINHKIIWANLNLLFCLSIIPFATAWMSETKFAHIPVAFYGGVLLVSGLSFRFLTYQLSSHHSVVSWFSHSKNRILSKENVSQVLNIAAATVVPFISPTLSVLIYFTVAVMWIFPSRSASVN